jgi:hypothetical protein
MSHTLAIIVADSCGAKEVAVDGRTLIDLGSIA